jgi:outer membrane protein assembly factor BamA
MDMEKKTNKIKIQFIPGIRQRISSIRFLDSLKGQNIVSYNMKSSVLNFKKGEYLDPKKIGESELNLYSLGTFDLVKIDTTGSKQTPNDSTIDILISLNYRKQNDYGFSLFFNQTKWNFAYNLGIEALYSNRNLFGASQVLSPYIRATLLDLNRAIEQWPKFEYEFSAGFNFSQPWIFSMWQWKFGFSMQPNFSFSNFNKYLRLQTFSLPFNFPVKLPDFLFYQNMNFNMVFERQRPMNYNTAISELVSDLSKGNSRDSLAYYETLNLYHNLNNYVNNNNPLLTSNLFGISFFGDKRDNPFSATRGYYTSLSIDGLNPLSLPFTSLQGIGKFARLQLMHLHFIPLSKTASIGLKGKFGYIYWWDKDYSYVSPERQFFAGGANSVRGWRSRRLRYYDASQYLANPNDALASDFVLDYIGSSTIIEASFEYRYRFSNINVFGDMIAEQLSSMGAVFFIDVGNAFQWMIVDDKGNYRFKYELSDYFTKLAISTGVGIRYETPVGPIRVDLGWPVFDPMRKKDMWIFDRVGGLKTLVLHVALGNAF